MYGYVCNIFWEVLALLTFALGNELAFSLNRNYLINVGIVYG